MRNLFLPKLIKPLEAKNKNDGVFFLFLSCVAAYRHDRTWSLELVTNEMMKATTSFTFYEASNCTAPGGGSVLDGPAGAEQRRVFDEYG